MILGFNADEIFQIAIEIEENGRVFYEKAAELASSPDLKELFSGLAREEIDHKNTFIDLKSELPDSSREGNTWDPENEINQYLKMMADMNVFKKRENVEDQLVGIGDVQKALRLAIQFEKDSILFYLLMQDFTQDDKGRNNINKLLNEEKNHLNKLARELRKYSECG